MSCVHADGFKFVCCCVVIVVGLFLVCIYMYTCVVCLLCLCCVVVVVCVCIVYVCLMLCLRLFFRYYLLCAFLLLCLTILVTIALSCRFHSSRGDGEQPVKSQSAVNTNTPLICSAVRCDKKLHTKERVRVDPWGWPEPGGLAQPDGSSHMLAPPGAYCDIGRFLSSTDWSLGPRARILSTRALAVVRIEHIAAVLQKQCKNEGAAWVAPSDRQIDVTATPNVVAPAFNRCPWSFAQLSRRAQLSRLPAGGCFSPEEPGNS